MLWCGDWCVGSDGVVVGMWGVMVWSVGVWGVMVCGV